MLTDIEKKIIAAVQADMPVCERPYEAIARQIGIREEVLLKHLQSLCDRGIIRRFGATLRHQRSGFNANAMAAWQIPEDRIAEAGTVFAAFKEVSHCYRRDPAPQWPYNLYTMIHAKNDAGCRTVVEKMSRAVGIDIFTLLFSHRELKKTSMTYFPTDEED